MRDEVGYREARDLLQKRYGSSYRIATAYVDKLTRGPAIKAEDGDALRRFRGLSRSCEVQDLIKSCLTMRDEVGYREARDLLQKRYGSSYRIATAYVDKLTRGPAIKAEDGDALRRFSIVLTGCKNTIVQRLPYRTEAEVARCC